MTKNSKLNGKKHSLFNLFPILLHADLITVNYTFKGCGRK